MTKKIVRMVLMCLFVLIANGMMAQNSITGTVKDETGAPLPGASVVVKGTTQGVITDVNGKFNLSVPANARLVISFVGMNSTEVNVGSNKSFNVQLIPSAIGVEEVVVTALGMKKEKKALGYNISSVNADQLEAGGTSNALKSLDGKVTGVQMNSLTSSPTSSVMFNIRGATSLAGIMKGSGGNINNETQPLIVLNGVPVSSNTVGTSAGIDVGNYMSSINPDDIESISILKGASAAALYGSSAGNGVILITTKSGAKAKKGLGVSINSALSFDQAYSAPPVQRRFFQGGEDGFPITDDKIGLGWAIDDNVNNQPTQQWNILTQKWEEKLMTARGDKSPLLAFLETGVMLDNNIGITGNYDKGNYRLNYGNMTYEGVVPTNKTIRNNVSFDATYKLNDKVSVSSQASYSRTFVPNQSHVYGKREDNPLAHAMSMPVNMPPMSEWKQADTWLTDWKGTYQNTPYLTNPGEPRLNRVNSSGFDKAVGKNGPYFAAENIIRTYSKDVFFGKVQLDWKLSKPLTFTLRSGLNHENFAFERKTPWGSERAEKGAYEMQLSDNVSVKSDALLAYNNYFVDNKLSVDGLAGFSYNWSEANASSFGGNELTTPNSFNYASLPASVKQAASFNRGYASRSYGAYATVTLGWQSMVYLDLSGRNDWVGILDHEKDHHFYPGASLSWIATETFKGKVDWLDLLKLRAGYATTGYGIGTPVNRDAYGISGTTWNGVTMGTIGGALVDANINPELNITKEGGFDFGLLKNRVTGEFTYFSKDHINQIQNLPVVASSGFSSVLTNMGSVESKGIEASITVVPVRTKDWEWSLTGNVTTFNSIIKDLDSRFAEKFYSYEGSAMLSLFKGSKVGDLYAQYPISYIETGKYKGMMLTGVDGIIEEAVTTTDHIRKAGYLGNMNPDAILGFNTDVRYKNWKLNVVASYRIGGVFISETQKIMVDDGMADLPKIYGAQYDDYWTGGRWKGGLANMPSPEAMFTGAGFESYQEKMQEIMGMYNGDKRYFGYWNAVYIDPNKDLSGMTPTEKLSLPDDYYIKNGADMTKTIILNPYGMEGNELWSGAQFRTHDATVFKIKEINLTYTFDKSVTSKLHMQDISITAFAKNVMFWAKNKMNEDPETAFRDGISGMGISQFGLPPLRTMGLKVGINF
jgi:TonB-linked SusC/RagA family outer membrane protein